MQRKYPGNSCKGPTLVATEVSPLNIFIILTLNTISCQAPVGKKAKTMAIKWKFELSSIMVWY